MRSIVTYGRRRSPEAEELEAADSVEPPDVRLGVHLTGGLAPAILGIVDRGVRRRPGQARELKAEIELRIEGGYPPVRLRFAGHEVLVEDGAGGTADVRIEAALTDLVSLMVSPAVGGVPLPFNARGRAALGMVVSRRVRIEGSRTLVRRVLALIRV